MNTLFQLDDQHYVIKKKAFLAESSRKDERGGFPNGYGHFAITFFRIVCIVDYM